MNTLAEAPTSDTAPKQATDDRRIVLDELNHAADLINCARAEIVGRRFGRGYRHAMIASHSLERIKRILSTGHAIEVIEEMRGNAAEVLPAYDAEITAHPEGGYALLWWTEQRTGKWPTRADALKWATINSLRIKPDPRNEGEG